MRMPVMQVRQMRMAMLDRLVPVRVRVRLGSFVAAVGMLVVRVVGVQVLVREVFMHMRVPMLLAEHQPGGRYHQRECRHEAGRHRLAQ